MALKRYSDEDELKLLREIDVHLHNSLDVVCVSEGGDPTQARHRVSDCRWGL